MHDPSAIQSPETSSRGTTSLSARDFQAALVEVLSPAFGYALRLTRNRADAEDLVQDAALSAFRAADTFEAGSNFKAWFFRILTRSAWARHRQRKRRPSTVEFDDVPPVYVYSRAVEHGLDTSGPDPARALMERIGTERITNAIDALPEEYGAVCMLYFAEDFAYQEIADVLDIPVGTVRSRLHRGRRMLQKALWEVAAEAGIVEGLARTRETT